MSLVATITHDLTSALKAREELRLSTLRMAKAALKNKEIELRRPLTEPEAQQVLTSMLKQREESVTQFLAGGRQELADKERAEMAIIEAYLPRQLAVAEVEQMVQAVVAETGAKGIKEMGAVMKAAMARFQAAGQRVDGKMVSEVVKRVLSQG